MWYTISYHCLFNFLHTLQYLNLSIIFLNVIGFLFYFILNVFYEWYIVLFFALSLFIEFYIINITLSYNYTLPILYFYLIVAYSFYILNTVFFFFISFFIYRIALFICTFYILFTRLYFFLVENTCIWFYRGFFSFVFN